MSHPNTIGVAFLFKYQSLLPDNIYVPSAINMTKRLRNQIGQLIFVSIGVVTH